MKKTLKKIIVILTVAFCLCSLCACGTNVDYYYTSDGDSITTEYAVTMPTELKNELNNSANASATGKSWTVEGYFTVLGLNFGFSVRNVSAGGKFSCYMGKTVNISDLPDNDDDDDKVSYEVENHFFTRRVTATQDNVFNGLYDEYTGKGDANTLISILANGYEVDGEEVLPAFTSAFPAASKYDPTDITLRFLWNVGDADVTPENGKTETINGEKYMVWDAKFDKEERKIVYSYSVTNPLGYYVVVLGVGLAVVGIILLATMKSRREPRMVEMKRGPVHYYHYRNNNNNNGSVFYYGDANRNDSAAQARRELDELFGTSSDKAPDNRKNATEIHDVFGGENDEDNEKRTK